MLLSVAREICVSIPPEDGPTVVSPSVIRVLKSMAVETKWRESRREIFARELRDVINVLKYAVSR